MQSESKIAIGEEFTIVAVQGFKIVDKDLCGRNKFQYTVGKTATAPGQLKMCENGLHYCAKAIDCLQYCTTFKPPYRYLRVIPMSEVKTESEKSVTAKLHIESEMSAKEWLIQAQKEYSSLYSDLSFYANQLLLIGAVENDVATMKMAIASGQIDQTYGSFQAMAAAGGHIDAMEFLTQQGITNISTAMAAAIRNNQLRVIKFLMKKVPRRSTMVEIATSGSLEAMRMVLEDDATYINDALVAIVSNASDDGLPIVKYLVEQKATAIEAAACNAMTSRNREIARFLTSLPRFDFGRASDIISGWAIPGKYHSEWFAARAIEVNST